ncbi:MULTISPECIES: tail fiber assembly protein [Pseudomonas]|uniref:tail fiber assembly protein n=1 Tax=Pseudomonas TaxID=286 RepID=UPI000C86CE76|nr:MULTISPECIES: tail fiber assembly protein [Pseudomonas]MBA4361974.1 hypothetical protein [Pseudomonas sp.]MSU92916.1 hypothetical protein [Pseudomonas mandelii]PMV78531.1 hypothetical protein C1X56_32480 [Pseudomonas sp. GW101-1A09]PMV83051.1 hypothetical protein C1X51_32305 [Pseudomonas sp. FW306-2-2C-B10A]PMV88711.1 hypothetical protein C1X55_33560 [Pseudomonas sp. GW460-C8]
MKVFAQVQDDRLHWKFEQDDQPEFAPDLVIIEITGVSPMPQEGWGFDGSTFSPPPPPSAEEIIARVQSRVSVERRRADEAVAPLQDALDIDEITDAERAELMLWKKYRVDLNRIPDQPGYPGTVDWPVSPD